MSFQKALRSSLAVGVIATLISPALTVAGRGLRLTMLVYGCWLLASVGGTRNFVGRVYREVRRRSVEVGMLLLWSSVVMANLLLGRGPAASNHALLTIVLLMVVSIEIAFTSLGESLRRSLVAAVTLILATDAARSVPALWSSPGIARAVMEAGASVAFVGEQALLGVGDYNLYTANAIVMPVLLANALSFRGVGRVVLMSACGAIVLAVTLSTFAGAFALLSLGLVGLVVVQLGHGWRGAARFLLFVLLVAGVGVSWFRFFGDSAQGRFVTEKLVMLAGNVGDEGVVAGDQTGRAGLFMMSLTTFENSPLVGIGPVTNVPNSKLLRLVGGHSSWIDQLAEYGLVGFGPFLVFVALSVRRTVKCKVNPDAHLLKHARIITACLFLVGGLVNPVIFIPNIIVAYFFVNLLGVRRTADMPIDEPVRPNR